ncbi:uncharacterized protein LOC123315287 [Coccinella septempunctata]|uniref:uncharacterized protein LOC123315287 n=1 Tax=Coccinella septempunctata TaxID=41139 RepID=UPI001D09662B|nr:uncharacterized protein LOC123315287 [Coccinella septempunctata]
MGDSVDSRAKTQEKETGVEKVETVEEPKETAVKTDEPTGDADKGDSTADEPADTGEKSKEATAEVKKENVEENKTETILSSQSLKSSNPSLSMPNDHVVVPPVTATPKNVKDRHLNRNQSDILPSLREIPREEDPSLMIFSSKGLPTKKYFRRKEVNSTILPFGFNEKEAPPTAPSTPRIKVEAELTPKINQMVPKSVRKMEEEAAKRAPFGDKNPNVPNPSVSRNVLTGCGVSSKDEFRSRSARRKDGNPVLGLGYDEPVVANNTGRVPPGGFSSGLW